MSISSLLIFLYAAIFAVSMMVMLYAYPFRKILAIRVLILLTLSFSLISFFNLNVYISQSFELKVLFSRFRFIGLGILGPSWLLFMSSLFCRWNWLQKRWATALIFAPGIVTIFLTLVPSWRPLVATNFAPYSDYGLSVVRFNGGAWFPYHIFFSYLMVLLSIVLGLWIASKERGQRRNQALILTFGCFIAAGIDVYCLYQNSTFRWLMLSGATFLFNEVAIVYAAFRYSLLDVAPLATEKVFNDIPDPILVIDSRGVLRSANQSAKSLFNLSSQSVGRKFSDVLPAVSLDKTDFKFEDADGVKRSFALGLEKLADSDGTPQGSIAFFREITAQKNIENRLNENLEFKARLLSLIAHDLSGNIKNQAILSNVIKNQIRPEYRNIASMMTESAIASQDLMENILSWAKSQEHQFEPRRKRFEINALIRDCVENLKTASDLKEIVISVQSEESPFVVNGDSEMIASVVRNLLSNAIRATPAGNAVYVEVRKVDQHVQVTIKDEGAGMSTAQINETLDITEAYFDKKDFTREGYGIGLKIARRFVEVHDGKFWLESQLGQGTSAHFVIPF